MDDFVRDGIRCALGDVQNRYEITNLLKELTVDIEVWDRENVLIDTTNELLQLKAKYKKQAVELSRVSSENDQLKGKLADVKKKSRALRDRFIMDIGVVLRESRRMHEQQSQKVELEKKIERSTNCVMELSDKVKELERTIENQKIRIGELSGESAIEPEILKMTFLDLDDEKLLQVFTFLDTGDVIATAQTCKSLYTRVDALFGIESSVAQGLTMDAPATQSGGASSSGADKAMSAEVKETPSAPDKMMQQLDDLSRKLSGTELKLILSLTDRVKSLSTEVEALRTEKEDIAANLQSTETVRDFLIEKLKGAEIALKSAIGEIGTLKRQAESDQEVIAYLDLRTNELENDVAEAQRKFKSMQGSIEVQNGAHSYMERLLTNEVADYKRRLDSAELTFKMQKKVLVKEVKALRARMAVMGSELEHYQSSLLKFREALNSTFAPKRS